MANPHRWINAALLTVAALGAALLVLGDPDASAVPPDSAPKLAAVYAPPLERADTHILGSGETLDVLLERAGFDSRERRNLLLALREHIDPRRLRPNVEVTVRRWADDDRTRAVELRLDADRTLRIDREPVGWDSREILTPVTLDTIYASGVIGEGQSLWQAIIEDEAVPGSEAYYVADRLAAVYMFQIDFYHDMRPRDAYRMVYEREVRPDGTARRVRVLAAEVHNRGELHPAIYFNPNGDDGDYFAPDGRSLRRAFRRYPLDHARVTSSFSWRRYHPILGRYRAHLGTDFGANRGTPVLATGDGTVVSAGRNGGYGNVIELRHPGGYTTRYAHLSSFARGIRSGRAVTQGEVIAYVGASGLATGPHLHYEFRRYGDPLNPGTVDLPGGPPVPDSLRDEFERVLESRTSLLARVPTPDGARLATVGDDAGPVSGAR